LAGQRIGYVRVSSFDQNSDRQLEDASCDRIFTDKASGKDTKRPQLQALVAFARAGDTVVVHSMDRLARNIEFVKEHLQFTGEDSPMANLMLSVMGAFAEFERALIRERQREGIVLANQRGVYRGRKRALSPDGLADARRRVDAGDKKAQIARELGISRETLYQYLRTAP
jgi:DNA invertase Pin-like site-specific DNA recombinase